MFYLLVQAHEELMTGLYRRIKRMESGRDCLFSSRNLISLYALLSSSCYILGGEG